MSSRADDEQARDTRVLIMGTEVGALQKRGRDRKCRTLKGVQSALKIQWREPALGDDVFAQIRKMPFERSNDLLRVARRLFRPIDVGLTQVGYGAEYVVRPASGRSERGVG